MFGICGFFVVFFFVFFFFFLMIRRPPRSTLFPYNDALPILLRGHRLYQPPPLQPRDRPVERAGPRPGTASLLYVLHHRVTVLLATCQTHQYEQRRIREPA